MRSQKPLLRHSEDGQKFSIVMATIIKFFLTGKETFQCLKDYRLPLHPFWTGMKLANCFVRSLKYQNKVYSVWLLGVRNLCSAEEGR
jgi:hypothetical protein